MLVIGVTGGLGTGKSTVVRLFRGLGAHTMDADAIAHQAMEPGTRGWRAIRRAFGTAVLAPRGRVDRRALSRIVFADHTQLRRLCAIIHPVVIARVRRELAILRRSDPRGIVVIEIPLLVEAGASGWVDRTVVVDATRAQQIARVRRATGWSQRAIQQRLRAQLPQAVKRRLADDVIDNTGTLSLTRRQVRALWKRLKAQAR